MNGSSSLSLYICSLLLLRHEESVSTLIIGEMKRILYVPAYDQSTPSPEHELDKAIIIIIICIVVVAVLVVALRVVIIVCSKRYTPSENFSPMPLAEEPSAPPLLADMNEVIAVEPSTPREPADMEEVTTEPLSSPLPSEMEVASEPADMEEVTSEEVATEPLSPPLPSEIEEIVAGFFVSSPQREEIEETVVESSMPSLLQELEEFVLQLFAPSLLAEMEEREAEHSRPPKREVPSMYIVQYPPPDCESVYNESCVCFSKFCNGEEVLMLPCSHLCHLQCATRIDPPRCPYCRRAYQSIA